MASTYTTGFGIEKIAAGEQSETWGTTTNYNLDIIDRIASYKAVAISGTTHTLTVREASPGSGTENLQDGMYRVIKFTGALGGNNTVTIAPNTSPAWFIIENATTDSGSSGPYTVILTQGSGANVTVQNGKNAIIYCDGAGSGAAVVNALEDLQVGTLDVNGSITSGHIISRAAGAAGGEISFNNPDNGAAGLTIDVSTAADTGRIFQTRTNSKLQIGQVAGTGGIVQLYTGGAERMRITSAGNVGIGTSSPGVPLDVNGNITSRASGTEGGQINFNNPDNAAAGLTIDVSAVDNGRIFQTRTNSTLQIGQVAGTGGTVKLYTGGAERMRISSAGLVGIGTSAPALPLHISSATPAIRLTDTDDNSDAQIGAAAGGLLVFDADIGNEAAGSAILFRVDGSSEKMRLTSAGNVGIGTTAPAEKLHVAGVVQSSSGYILNDTNKHYLYSGGVSNIGVRFNNGGTATGYMFLKNFASGVNGIGVASGSLALGTASTARMYIDSAGLVGIGVSAPSAPLDVRSDGLATGSKRFIALLDVSSISNFLSTDSVLYLNNAGAGDTGIHFRANTADYSIRATDSSELLFEDDAVERMRISSAGNVGIGTTAPGTKLEISTSGIATLRINDSSSTTRRVDLSNSSGYAVLTARNGATNTGFYVQGGATSSKYVRFHETYTQFYTSDTERMRIDSSGNVGIGTSSPSKTLDVDGQLRIRNGGATGYALLEYGASATATNNWHVGSEGDGTYRFYNGNFGAGTERMRITSAGKVGIGTSTPDSGTPLHVQESSASLGTNPTASVLLLERSGNVAMTLGTANTGNASIFFGDPENLASGRIQYDNSDNALEFWANSGERMRITSAGNVGIGDSAPTAMLDVAEDAAFGAVASAAVAGAMVSIRQPMAYDPADGDGTSAINIITQTTLTNGSKMGGISWARMTSNGGTTAASISAIGETTTATGLAFGTGTSNTERMRITSAGNVGIGKTAPSSLLHLASTGSAILTLEADTDNADESHNARIELSQDGGAVTGHMGYATNANGISIWNNYGDYLRFGANNLERMRITGGGNVGIGTTTPGRLLEVSAAGAAYIRVRSTVTSGDTFFESLCSDNTRSNYLYFGDLQDVNVGNIRYNHQSNFLSITTNASERIRITSVGKVGIGRTAPSYDLDVDGTFGMYAATTASRHIEIGHGRTGNGYSFIDLIGDATYTDYGLRIIRNNTGANTTSVILHRGTGALTLNAQDAADMTFHTSNAVRFNIQSSGVVRPGASNVQSFGSASYLWSEFFANNGTINTSDEREKQQIADLDDAELRVAVALKGLVKKYKYNDAVELKGDGARIHVGVIAQEVVAAFAAEGLDATRYSLLCYDVWDAEPEITDDEGNVTTPALDAGNAYGIRYNELLAFIIAAM
tara:strand:- start:435 stop:4628 length:4194 start_codon:yes stop_codon:yes gene_type:complete